MHTPQTRSPKEPAWIWTDPDGTGRIRFALFRSTFCCDEVPPTCTLHLFGDTRYHLRVDGATAGHGPARCLPLRPEFDSYNIAPFLHQGRNVIVVEVYAQGESAHSAAPSRGRFIAWGGADAGLDLRTPGDWRALESHAWDPGAALWSSALPAVEILDQRALPPRQRAVAAKCSEPTDARA